MSSSLSQTTFEPVVRSHRAALDVVVSRVTAQHEGKPPVIMYVASWTVALQLNKCKLLYINVYMSILFCSN